MKLVLPMRHLFDQICYLLFTFMYIVCGEMTHSDFKYTFFLYVEHEYTYLILSYSIPSESDVVLF